MMKGLIDNEPPSFGMQTGEYQHVRGVVEAAQSPLGLKTHLLDSDCRIHCCHHVQLFPQLSVADHEEHTSIADVHRKLLRRIN